MKVLCAFGEHQYGDPKRGLGTEYGAFVPALKNLGYEVVHFETLNRTIARDYADLNRRLLETVRDIRPDLMLVVPFRYELWLETLETIRAMGVATMCWTTDDSWKYVESSKFYGPYFDAITTTYDYQVDRYEADGIHQVYLTQWAASSASLMAPKRAVDCEYEVSFVGAAHGNRREQIDKLRAAGIEAQCFGFGWSNGPIAAEDMTKIMNRSIVTLNFSNTPGYRGPNQIKARTFEAPGSGTCLLTEDAPGLSNWYVPNREIAIFRDAEEMIERIRYLTTHLAERDMIAEAGYRRTAEQHTYEKRLAGLIQFTLAQKQSQKPSGAPPDFEVLERRHRLTPALNLLRKSLVAACRPIWGTERGSKAARRLVFEVSRRIAGRHTFTAAGLPGRMFPEQ